MRVDARDHANGDMSAIVNLLLGEDVVKPFIRVSLKSGTLVWYDVLNGRRQGIGVDLMLYVTPTEERVTTVFLMRFMYNMPWIYHTLRPLVPLWIDHAQNNLTFDGDTPFLQWQEGIVRLATTETRAKANIHKQRVNANGSSGTISNGNNNNNKANGTWRDAYVMSTSTHDCLVADFRKWNDVTSPLMPFPLLTSSSSSSQHGDIQFLDKRDINDRYKWHTKDCLACSAALRNLRILKWVCIAIAAVLLAATVAVVVVATAVVVPTAAVRKRMAWTVMGILTTAGIVMGVGVAAQKGIDALTYNDLAYRLQQKDDSPDKEMMAPMFRNVTVPPTIK